MKKFILYTIILAFPTQMVLAQLGTSQEVKVVKPYEPIISDAFKISELPRINDTLEIVPSFEYDINAKKYKTEFSPKTIKPAKLINEPLSKLYYTYLRLGFGSHYTPLAEIMAGSKRSEIWQWDSKLVYKASNGKVKNEAGDKVFGGFSDFKVSANTKFMFENNTELGLGAKYSNQVSYFYGYNPDNIDPDSTPPLAKDDMEKQLIHSVDVYGKFKSNHTDSAHINHESYVEWNNTSTIDNYSENSFNVGTRLSYFFQKEFVGIDINVETFANDGFSEDYNYGVVSFDPWIGAFGNKWRVFIGVNTAYKTDSAKYYFYPRISLQYNIIDFFLMPYIEVDGNYKINTFNSLYSENKFIVNDLVVEPTNNRINLAAGFRGNISSKVAFNIKFEYGDFANQYFYVNDTSLQLENKFNVVYDHMKRIEVLGEISYKNSEKLMFTFKGKYHYYDLKTELHAWHKPDYEFSLGTRYSIQEKFIIDLNVIGIGKRYAREFNDSDELTPIELQGIIDLNLGFEYRYSKKLSAFVTFNNIAAMHYYKWNHYPTQQFNLMLGLSYSF